MSIAWLLAPAVSRILLGTGYIAVLARPEFVFVPDSWIHRSRE